MRRLLLIITTFLCLTGVTAAQSGGGYASPFTLGAGARDLALSGANLAQADFATAAYWNASRLARAERRERGARRAANTPLRRLQAAAIDRAVTDLAGFTQIARRSRR